MTNPIADISVPELGHQVALLDVHDIDQSSLDVCTLAAHIRAQYRRALVARDQAAASLARTGPPTEGCTVRDLHERQHVVRELRELLARTYEQAVRLLPAASIDHHLPSTPTLRVAHYAHWLRFLEGNQAANDASRILSAAILARHHGWSLAEAADLAQVSVAAVTAAMNAAGHSPPSGADPGLLRWMVRLAGVLDYNVGRLTAVRDQAVRESLAEGASSQLVAAHVGLPDQVRTAHPEPIGCGRPA